MLRVIDDLQQEIAELVLERVEIAPRDRVGDLVGLLDRVGRDGREVLLRDPTDSRVSGSRKRAMTASRSSSVWRFLRAFSAIATGAERAPERSCAARAISLATTMG